MIHFHNYQFKNQGSFDKSLKNIQDDATNIKLIR